MNAPAFRQLRAVGDIKLLSELARSQHGCFNGDQAGAVGFDRRDSSYRVRAGAWVRIGANVFALAGTPPTWERQMSAAILSRTRAIVGGASAAYLHGFAGFGPQRPVIVVPWSASGRSSLAKVIRSQWFATLPRDTIRGFSVTSAAETLTMLAAYVSKSRVVRLFEDGLAANRFELVDFDEIFERVDGARVRGIGMIRKLCATHSADAPEHDASYLERLMEMLLAEPAIPHSIREFRFQLPTAPARVDAYLPDWEIVIEADGRNEHSRRNAFAIDRRRDNELAAKGILVMRFTYDDLRNHRDKCLRVLVEAGRHRSAS